MFSDHKPGRLLYAGVTPVLYQQHRCYTSNSYTNSTGVTLTSPVLHQQQHRGVTPTAPVLHQITGATPATTPVLHQQHRCYTNSTNVVHLIYTNSTGVTSPTPVLHQITGATPATAPVTG